MVVYSFVQLYYTISGEELFVFKSKKCRIYAACGVSQTPRKIKKCEVDSMDFTILAVVLLIGVGIPVRNKLIRKYREEKKKQDKNRDEK